MKILKYSLIFLFGIVLTIYGIGVFNHPIKFIILTIFFALFGCVCEEIGENK